MTEYTGDSPASPTGPDASPASAFDGADTTISAPEFSVTSRALAYPQAAPVHDLVAGAAAGTDAFAQETLPAFAIRTSVHELPDLAPHETDEEPEVEPAAVVDVHTKKAPAHASEPAAALVTASVAEPVETPAPPVVEPAVDVALVDVAVVDVATLAPAPIDAPAEPDPVLVNVPEFAERNSSDLFLAPSSDLATIGSVQPPAVARRGIRGFFGGIGIKMAPGAAEQEEIDAGARLRRNEEIIRQATWTRAVSVLVANRKGGVGKTPVSLLLGGTLASVRGGSVCVVEVSDDPGALTFRAEGNPRLGLGELVRSVDTVVSAGQLAGYTAPQTSFASVIGSIGDRVPLTSADVVAVSRVIDEFYSVRVMDSGNQSSSPAFTAAVGTADALVIPVLNAGDAVFEAVALLERLRAEGGRSAELANRAVIIRLTDGRPEHPQVLERINRIIAGAGAAHVFSVPYDAHIAERGQLTLGSLNPATYDVFAAAAAAIVEDLRIESH
ncbi:MAG: MinD-like ATPase involved in chromosome partitioning or flagellar assembly [Glaciihabitans sp.]|nr:MinD-like ATPase involved in chromosome partitioning or flagellar assembly [Glaciihabitans sp.]